MDKWTSQAVVSPHLIWLL